ncbi:MAG: ATP-dependent DNA helicase RecG [Eubacteriaceae bacterium]|nr:ATP-dependent DNA helicase RecG [Eubacteriaceae bacterium]
MFYPENEITVLKGVGGKKANALSTIGIKTIGQLLDYFPSDYRQRRDFCDFSQAQQGQYALIRAVYTGIGSRGYSKGTKSRWTLSFDDGRDIFPVVFYNQPYIKDSLKKQGTYRLYGKLYPGGGPGGKVMISPVLERDDIATYLKPGIYPVYSLSVKSGLKQKQFVLWMKEAVENTVLTEQMPLRIGLEYDLEGIEQSYRDIHFPGDEKDAVRGARYFIMQKFMSFNIGLNKSVALKETQKGRVMDISFGGQFVKSLPFELTGAQKRALDEILADMSSGGRMNRLLQGDVGSGKTFVAVAAAYIAVANGFQAAICAPTEILARQHKEKYSRYFEAFGFECAVLYSGMKKKQREETLAKIADGRTNVIFGTHALFSKDVVYRDLAFISIDEQHRYGVAQRAALESKGVLPHVLVMSATPIPRTMALSIYKDLSLSIIDELPAGRLPITTFLFNSTQDKKAYAFVAAAAEKGLKTFIVCPAIDSADMENVNEVYEESVKILSPNKVGFITGEMSEDKKTEIMNEFASGETNILVSTTIIEVGIDVPEAVIMWIKGAERFGLSQLHQLRGRVGRGREAGYCFLQTDSDSPAALKRLTVLKNTTDGFEISREDMRLRGAGEIFGLKQSGKTGNITEYALEYPDLFMAASVAAQSLAGYTDDISKAFYEKLKKEGESLFGRITMN